MSKYNYNEVQLKLLQSLFSEQSLIPNISSQICAEDFSDDKLRAVFTAMSELNSEGNNNIQVSDLYNYHIEKNLPFPQDLFTEMVAPVDDSAIGLSKILKRLSVQEKTKTELTRVTNLLNEDRSDMQEILGKTEDFLSKMTQNLLQKDEVSHYDTVYQLYERINQKEAPEVDTVPLFFKSLEEPLKGGWHPEQLITIGARTSVGKSVFAVDSAVAACIAGRSVLFFSLEMSKEELLKRMLSVVSGVLLNKLEPGIEKTAEEQQAIKEATKEIASWKLTIEDQPDVTLEHIKARSKMVSQQDTGLDFIIVDYLQLINPGNTGRKSRQEVVADLSRGMKLLAKQLKVPVMIVVQLNREDKNEDEERLPSKADIRESGAIAADSDVIIILHRKYRDDSPDPKALFILDKNRNGPVNRKYSMRCVLEKSMFMDIEAQEEETDFTQDDLEDFIEGTQAPNLEDFFDTAIQYEIGGQD